MADARRPMAMTAASRTALLVDAVLLLVMWLGAIGAWFSLPDRFPIHFDLTGRPDGWATRSGAGLFVWLLLPAVASATSALLRWTPRAALANPSLWNIPHKRELMALPPERRVAAQAILADSMAMITVLTTALLLLVQLLMWISARGGHVHGSVIALAAAGYIVATIIVAVRASRRAGDAILEAARSNER